MTAQSRLDSVDLERAHILVEVDVRRLLPRLLLGPTGRSLAAATDTLLVALVDVQVLLRVHDGDICCIRQSLMPSPTLRPSFKPPLQTSKTLTLKSRLPHPSLILPRLCRPRNAPHIQRQILSDEVR